MWGWKSLPFPPVLCYVEGLNVACKLIKKKIQLFSFHYIWTAYEKKVLATM